MGSSGAACENVQRLTKFTPSSRAVDIDPLEERANAVETTSTATSGRSKATTSSRAFTGTSRLDVFRADRNTALSGIRERRVKRSAAQRAVQPPSTTSGAPVNSAPPGPRRYATASATSDGS